MSLAMLSLIAIQFFWIRHAIRLQETRFSENVNHALSDVAEKVGQRETWIMVKKDDTETRVEINESDSSLSPISSKNLPIDSLIKFSLAEHGIASGFEATIIEETEEISESGNRKIFTRRIKSLDGTGENQKIKIAFTPAEGNLIRNMGLVLSTSGLIIVLIMIGFGLIVWSFFRQKKLSELKTDFINNMTHELKTPISTISLAAEALLDQQLGQNAKQTQHFAQIISLENKRLKDRVEQVLRMARLEKGGVELNKVELDLHTLIDEELSRIRERFADSVGKPFSGPGLKLELKATKSKIIADPLHISGVISNILDNAINYSPEDPQISVCTRNEGKWLVFSVADKGKGISKDQLKRIFDLFYRVPTGNLHDVKGFGLGLNYANAMVIAHGGYISVKSQPGKGSLFEVFLPGTEG